MDARNDEEGLLRAARNEFPAMISGEVLIEERKVAIEITSESWRSRLYRLPGVLPRRLPPEFCKTVFADDLEVLKFARECYKGRIGNTCLQQPYSYLDSTGRTQTVLRTITCKMTYHGSKKIEPRLSSLIA